MEKHLINTYTLFKSAQRVHVSLTLIKDLKSAGYLNDYNHDRGNLVVLQTSTENSSCSRTHPDRLMMNDMAFVQHHSVVVETAVSGPGSAVKTWTGAPMKIPTLSLAMDANLLAPTVKLLQP